MEEDRAEQTCWRSISDQYLTLTNDMDANMFTKALPKHRVSHLNVMIGLHLA